MEARLLNISKTSNAKDFIKVILKSSCRVLLGDDLNTSKSDDPNTARVFAKGG